MTFSNAALASGAQINDRLKKLATFTDVEGEMTRLTLSPAHKQAIAYLTQEFKAAGMEVYLDAMGSLHGRYNPHNATKTLLIGSHIDTVRNAGIYDGNLGVITGLAVIEALHRSGKTPSCALELIAFGDEEGVRFPSTLTGSKFVAGDFKPSSLSEVDADGISREQALRALGTPAIPPHAPKLSPDVIGYVEVHIEQGPVLQAHDMPLGIVSAINGVTRGHITIKGMAGHAGTLPMSMRHDALTAAAEIVLAFEQRALQTADLVATNGVLYVKNPAINVVAGEVQISFDVRSPRDEDRQKALHDIWRAIDAIAAKRGVTTDINIGHEAPATPCDPQLMHALTTAAAAQGLKPLTLPSGAGHDAMSFHGKIPLAMLFVRCHDGISHNPLEAIREDDVGLAAKVLFDMIMAQ
jgi:allantoate deiminase